METSDQYDQYDQYGQGQAEGEGGEPAPPPPPHVVLTPGSTAGFDPSFPEVGTPIRYYWMETNYGGPTADSYRALVALKNDDTVVQEAWVDCARLDTNESANREVTLDAPTAPGIGYSIELWVDHDNTSANEGTTYAYHAITVDEPFGS